MKRERIIVGKGTDYPLKGLLTLPSSNAGKVPAVVLVHGSGASNMDERVYKLTPFKDLADGLAKQGIASVRYSQDHHFKWWFDVAPVRGGILAPAKGGVSKAVYWLPQNEAI